MIIENPEDLKTWLTAVLTPLCDADPAALSKYVFALAKKDRPEEELRKTMLDQLEVFLQKETSGFIDTLFEALKSKSYLGSSAETSGKKDAVATNGVAAKTETLEVPQGETQSTEKTAAVKAEEKKDPRELSKRKTSDKDERRGRRRSWSSRSRSKSRSRSRDRFRRSRSRDRIREKGRGWDDRRRRSPAGRRAERRRSRTRSKSPRSRSRPYRSRSRSPKDIAKTVGDEKKVVPAVTSEPPPTVAETPTVPPLTIQSVVVAPGGDRSRMRCRDYDEKGFCMRGDLCPYDHGNDPVVLDDVELNSMLTYHPPGTAPIVPPPNIHGPPPPFPPPGDAYNPDAPGINWPPPGFPGAGAPPRGPHGMMMRPMGPRGGLYGNPPPFGLPPPRMGNGLMRRRPPHPSVGLMQGPPPRGAPMGPTPGGLVPPPQRELISVATEAQDENAGPKRAAPEALVGTEHGAPKKGHFDYNRLGGRPRHDPTNCSLEVKNIPAGLNNISSLNNHFDKFGKIVNLQVCFNGDPKAAVVTFSSHAEAQTAYQSPEAVLNNRFIKVFWHNKETAESKQENVPPGSKSSVKERLGSSHGRPPPKVGEETEDLKELAKEKEKEREKTLAAIKRDQEILAAKEAVKKKQEEQKRAAAVLQADLQRMKQELLHKQLQQQRVLIDRLEKSKGTMKPEEKTVVLKTMKELQESIEKLKQDLEHTVLKETNIKAVSGAPKAAVRKQSLEVLKKEMLDAEIELYQKQQAGDDTTALLEKVKDLRAQAMSLAPRRGMARGVGRRGRARVTRGAPSRGRGRGGFYVPPNASVDRRPTQLRVTGFEAGQEGDVLEHFASFGDITSHETDDSVPSLTVRFRTRKQAELAFIQGKTFKDQPLSVTWFCPSSGKPLEEEPQESELTVAERGGAEEEEGQEEEEENGNDDEEEVNDLLNYEEDEEEDGERSWRR